MPATSNATGFNVAVWHLPGTWHVAAAATAAKEERSVLALSFLLELRPASHQNLDDFMLSGVTRRVQGGPRRRRVPLVNVATGLQKTL